MFEFAILEEQLAPIRERVEQTNSDPTVEDLVELAWHLRQRNPTSAHERATEALRRHWQSDRPCPLVASRAELVLGEVALLTQELSIADEFANRALERSKTSGDAIGCADAHLLLSFIFRELGQLDKCTQCLRMAMEAAQTAGDRVRADIALVLWATQTTLKGLDPEIALQERIAQCLREAERSPVAGAWIHYYQFLVQFSKGDFAAAAPHALRCGELAACTGQREREIHALSGLGACYSNLGDHEQAMNRFSSVLELAKAAGWVSMHHMALYQIGACLTQMGRAEAGIEFLGEVRNAPAISARSRTGTLARVALMCALNKIGRHQEALDVASEFSGTTLSELHLDMQLQILIFKGQALAGMNRREEAMTTFTSALALCRRDGRFKGAEVSLLLNAAAVWGAQAGGSPQDEALLEQRRLLVEAVELDEALGGSGESTDAYEACAAVHARLGEHAAAYGYLAKAVDAKTRSLTASAVGRSVALQITHQTEQAKAEAKHHRELAATLLRSNASLQTLARIGQDITRHLDERTVFELLVRDLGELLAADHLSIYLLQGDSDILTGEFSVEHGRPLPRLSISMTDERSLVARCARERSVIAMQWDALSSKDGRVISGTQPVASLLYAPLLVSGRLLGVMSVQSTSPDAYTGREEQIFLSLCAYVAIAFANAQAYRDLTNARSELEQKNEMLNQAYLVQQEASNTDPLTQLKNRRFIAEQLEKEVALVDRLPGDDAGRRPVGLVFFLVDVDHFKAVNDQWGHAAGDAVLQQIAGRLRAMARHSDYVVRWGGEEFLYVARMSSPKEAPAIAERICLAIEAEPFVLADGRLLPKTCSVGFAQYPTHRPRGRPESWERSVELADEALYMAKREGRNRWVGHSFDEALSADGQVTATCDEPSQPMALLRRLPIPEECCADHA